MPYESMEDVNPAIKGIEPAVTLAQANIIADWADEIEKSDDPPDSPWAVAIANFKKAYEVDGEKWVKKEEEEEERSVTGRATDSYEVGREAAKLAGFNEETSWTQGVYFDDGSMYTIVKEDDSDTLHRVNFLVADGEIQIVGEPFEVELEHVPAAGEERSQIRRIVDRVAAAFRGGLAMLDSEPPKERALHASIIEERIRQNLYEAKPGAVHFGLYVDDEAFYTVAIENGRLYRAEVDVAGGEVRVGAWEEVEEMHEPVKTARASSITVQRQADGRLRWTALACTAVLNREDEIDSTRLFDDMIRRAQEKGGEYPFATMYHLGELFRVGSVDTMERDGVVLVESGLFDEENELAERLAGAIEGDVNGEWGGSIQYAPVGDPEILIAPSGAPISVYNEGAQVEFSFVKERHASSLFTSISTTKEVRNVKDEVAKVIRELYADDPEKAESLIAQSDEINRIAEGLIARKKADPKPAPKPAPKKDPKKGDPPEPVIRELDESAVAAIAAGIMATPEFVGLGERLDSVEGKIDALKEEEEGESESDVEKEAAELRTRLDTLEASEKDQKERWLNDLPPRDAVIVSYRAREDADPKEQTPEEIAEATLAGMPEKVRGPQAKTDK